MPSQEAADCFRNLIQATSSYFDESKEPILPQADVKGEETESDREFTTMEEWQKAIVEQLRRDDLPNISLDPYGTNHRRERGIVRSAMNGGGAFTVKSHTRERRYKIVFPEEAPPPVFVVKENEDGSTIRQTIRFSYLPYCSCRAYLYQSYDQHNNQGTKGGCKHLRDVIDFADTSPDFSEYNWNSRPEDRDYDPWAIRQR